MNFIIISESIIFRGKIEKTIRKIMKTYNIPYQIFYKMDVIEEKKESIWINIIDFEDENCFDTIQKIKKNHPNSYTLFFTHDRKKKNLLLQHHLLQTEIADKSMEYEKSINKFLQKIQGDANQNNKKENFVHYEKGVNYIIPKKEIEEVISFKGDVIVKAINDLEETYTCHLNLPFLEFAKQLDKDFLIEQDHYALKKSYDNTNIQISLNIKKEKSKRKYIKPYSKEEKEKILSLYHDGMSIYYLSKNYTPSYTTISKWLKQEQYEKTLATLQEKALKFDKIYEITTNPKDEI